MEIAVLGIDVHLMLLSPPMPATIAADWWEGSSSHYVRFGAVGWSDGRGRHADRELTSNTSHLCLAQNASRCSSERVGT